MKYLVDKMPESANSCPNSYWKPYPPIVKETGRFIGDKDDRACDYSETGMPLVKCFWEKD